MEVKVIGSVFAGPGREGDFRWMIEQAEYTDALFVFNDNEEQFLAHIDQPGSPAGCAPGGGNAAIRPLQCASPPRAAGIPTGTLATGGYPALSEHVRLTIDRAVARIRHLVAAQEVKRLYYSAGDDSGVLGTGIFVVDEAVKRYIVDRLRDIGA